MAKKIDKEVGYIEEKVNQGIPLLPSIVETSLILGLA